MTARSMVVVPPGTVPSTGTVSVPHWNPPEHPCHVMGVGAGKIGVGAGAAELGATRASETIDVVTTAAIPRARILHRIGPGCLTRRAGARAGQSPSGARTTPSVA